MNPYLKQLMAELDQYTASCANVRPSSVLDLLWYCYLSANAIDDGQIKKSEDKLIPVFEELSVMSEDALFEIIAELVTAYQRAAFLEGMQIGAQLSAGLLHA